MGALIYEAILDLYTGVQPFFDFLHALWSAFPMVYRYVFSMLFGVAITFVIIKNIIL